MEYLRSVYSRLITSFFDKQLNDTKSIFFFQGFPGEFYDSLSSNNTIKHFCNKKFSSLIDINEIDAMTIVQKLITSTGPVWGFYEELIALTRVINDFSISNKKIYVVKNNLFKEYYPLSINCDEEFLSRIYENDLSDVENELMVQYYSGFKNIDGTFYFSYVNKHYPIDITSEVIELDFFPKNNKDYHIENAWERTIITNSDLLKIKLRLLNGKIHEHTYIIKSTNNDLEDEISYLNTFASNFNVFFKIDNLAHKINYQNSNKYLHILQKHWGAESEFYNLKFYIEPTYDNKTHELSQGLLISNIIEQCELAMMPSNNKYSDIIITAPTGAGKSLFYQLPAIYLHEKYKALTIVVSPLVALMNDQVSELHQKGVYYATFINSDITYEERQKRLEGIASGEYSIVYMSPELLLAYDIKSLIGNRKIGLLAIDEAHLVTSWGRDFRVDYWFLGDYLEKIRRGNYFKKHSDAAAFPVLCLTATAVYGGRDDVIEDLQRSLNLSCSTDKLYIGYVKRDNISFKINIPDKQFKSSKKEEKVNLTCKRVSQFLENKEKSIIYFPFVSQIDDVKLELTSKYPNTKGFVERYSGSGMKGLEKNEAYLNFKKSDVSIMLATKAFGMGVNISDIVNVYHFAPTGTLADYVQEIGRAARKIDYGYAIIDYLHNDMRYANTLWGLSGLRHYQIKAIMKKLYDLYQTKKSRNLIFSPDTFSFLFDANNLETKVKSGLMLLSADLFESYHFRVLNVRPKNLLASHYIVIPMDVEHEFLNEFGKYCTKMDDDEPRITPGYGRHSTMITTNIGNIYEIELSKVWEEKFNNLTFAKFKFHFFEGDLFTFGANKVLPRIKLTINYDKGYEHACENLLKIARALQKTFNEIYRTFGGKQFELSIFTKTFIRHLGERIRREYLLMLLDLFCYEKTDIYEIPNEQWKFIERSKDGTSEFSNEKSYCIRTAKHGYIESNIKRYLKMAEPNNESQEQFVSYLKIPKRGESYSEYQLVASLLELFGYATYDLIGGRNPQIFVRINDPLKLKRISESNREYRNRILSNIDERHKRAAVVVDRFMTLKLNDEERWDLIENYFLGFDGAVDSQLGIIE